VARILVVGEDPWLLQSRAILLRYTGAETVSCTTREVAANSEIGGVDVLVMCHTIAPEVRRTFAASSRKRWPGVRVLQMLRADFQYYPPTSHADATALGGNAVN
jgi:hypothetical protein